MHSFSLPRYPIRFFVQSYIKMRFSSLVCGLSLLSSALALYIPSLEEAGDAIEKRADIVATTGIPGATYPRLEVRQMLFNKPNQWYRVTLSIDL